MKTTYRRQFTMILCLLVAAILVIGLSFLYLFDRYAQDHQKQSLDDTAQSVTELVQSYSATYLNSWEFRTNLAVAARASDNDIVICNGEGVVCICMERSNCEHLGKRLDSDTVDTLFQGEKAKLSEAVSALYGDERMASAIAVLNSDGSRLCIVVVSVQKAAITALTGKMLRVFLLAAVLILVAALLAIPIFTRREARPIQEMAAAARQIAHGNLDVRVPTGNENEEMEELAVAFNNMTLALKNSETIRNEFVANISHELKTSTECSTARSRRKNTAIIWSWSAPRRGGCRGWCAVCWIFRACAIRASRPIRRRISTSARLPVRRCSASSSASTKKS